MGKIHPTHCFAAFSSGDFGQEAVVVCLSCAAYTCGKVYALAEASSLTSQQRLTARESWPGPGLVLTLATIARAGGWPPSWCSWALRER